MFFYQWPGKDMDSQAFPHSKGGIDTKIAFLADTDAAHRINL